MKLRVKVALVAVGLLLAITGSSGQDSAAQTPAPRSTHPRAAGGAQYPVRLQSNHLPNPVQIHDKVISGGLPESDAAFEELVDLGVKTIISVDGMKPEVARARKFGLRYIHLPHGYAGIPEDRALQLAKAVREMDGRIFIHCHHGKHRSPAAAAVACVSAGFISRESARSVLELAGTDPAYLGLYAAARDAVVIEPQRLDALDVEYKAVQDVPPMADAMVQLSHTQDHVKLIAAAGWKSPPEHPDLEPAHEALLIREQFSELLRSEEASGQAADFQLWLRDSESAAMELESLLIRWQTANATSAPPIGLSMLANRISDNCKACHVKYRDIPRSEKP